MPNLVEMLAVLSTTLSGANIYKLSEIAINILCLSQPVSTRSIGRMSSLSLRTIERFYAQKPFDWLLIRVILFKNFFFESKVPYLLVGDETVQKKAGKQSYGLGSFYSSLFGRAVTSVSFLGLSLVNTQTGKSTILSVDQLVKDKTLPKSKTKNSKKSPKKGVKGSAGRPKGSKNKPYTEPESLSFQILKSALTTLLAILGNICPDLIAPYLVLDGFYGNQHYLKLAASYQLHLITKLRHDAHLIWPYQGEQKANRKPKKLGKKLDYDKIPAQYQVSLPLDHPLHKKNTTVFQVKTYANAIKGQLLNIVIIRHYNPKTKKIAQSVLMSGDLGLDALTLIKYYSLRFQIEFDFRDAKQYFGLASFKNYKQNQLTNAVNMAFTMSLITRILLEKYQKILGLKSMSIIDLKACLRLQFYAYHLLNNSQINPDTFFNDDKILDLLKFEAINL